MGIHVAGYRCAGILTEIFHEALLDSYFFLMYIFYYQNNYPKHYIRSLLIPRYQYICLSERAIDYAECLFLIQYLTICSHQCTYPRLLSFFYTNPDYFRESPLQELHAIADA